VRLCAYASANTRCVRKGKANTVNGRSDEGNLTAGSDRTRRRPASPVAGRYRKRRYLRNRPRIDAKTPRRFPAGSHLQSELHIDSEHRAPRPSSPGRCGFPTKAICCRFFTPAQPDYPAASVRNLAPELTYGGQLWAKARGLLASGRMAGIGATSPFRTVRAKDQNPPNPADSRAGRQRLLRGRERTRSRGRAASSRVHFWRWR
jgi:hypothetical protein